MNQLVNESVGDFDVIVEIQHTYTKRQYMCCAKFINIISLIISTCMLLLVRVRSVVWCGSARSVWTSMLNSVVLPHFARRI